MASKKKVTTKDIARYANVSQSAVSMILNKKKTMYLFLRKQGSKF